MRSGEEVRDSGKAGGAWFFATMRSAPKRTGEWAGCAPGAAYPSSDMALLLREADCTKGRCVEGMVSQQFLPLLWGEQGIVLQHCIA